jgi:hypothetical protein
VNPIPPSHTRTLPHLCLSQGLRSFGLLYYNAATALPLSLGIAFMRGEIDDLLVFPHATNPVREMLIVPPSLPPSLPPYLPLIFVHLALSPTTASRLPPTTPSLHFCRVDR